MVKEITAWIREELYPALYDRIPEAFPEHSFRSYAYGWRSKTYLDGSPHKSRADKTKVLHRAPGYIFEEGGDRKSLVDYVMERDRIPFIDAVRKLAEVAGLPLPTGRMDQEDYRAYRERASVLEDANGYLVWCLQHAEGKDADNVRAYLQVERGYTMEEVEAMELGYLPSQDKLQAFLQEKGHTAEAIEEALHFGKDKRIGTSYKLTIPYRSGNTLRGFSFRTIGEEQPKYLNSSGLDRKGALFNLSPLKGEKDLVVVEGYLDALHATVKGIPNVVATASASLSREHLEDAIARGARKVTLSFDNDQAGEKATDAALELLHSFPQLKVYVVRWEDGEEDPDQVMRARGGPSFRGVVEQAVPAWEYQLGKLLDHYGKLEAQGELYPKDVDRLTEEALHIAVDLEPTDRDRFTSAFLHYVEGLGITKESLLGAQERLRYERDREDQRKALGGLVSSVNRVIDQDPTEAVERLEEGLQELRRKRGSTLLQPATYSGWLERMAVLPPALRTGYAGLDRVARIPQAAITLIAGRPRHGKTTTMLNLLLRMAGEYPKKKFLFFTYEEPSSHLLTKALNILVGENLMDRFHEYPEALTNYSFLRSYLRHGREDLEAVEKGKAQLREHLDSGRVQVLDGSHTVEDLRAILASLQAEEVGAVFLDYIQRMRTEKRTQDKRTEIAHISDQLLQAAKETGLPIVLGAQISRAASTTTEKRPALEHLKEAGNLEEDANLVLSVYNRSAEEETAEDGGSWGREVPLELKALKNRDGQPNGRAELLLDSWTGKVKDTL